MYVVGALNFFHNEVVMEKVEATSKQEALMKCHMLNGFDFSSCHSFEDMQSLLFDNDISANVIKI